MTGWQNVRDALPADGTGITMSEVIRRSGESYHGVMEAVAASEGRIVVMQGNDCPRYARGNGYAKE